MEWMDILESSPVIAAVKDDDGLKKALLTECQIIFTLYGSICSVPEITERIREAKKTAIVHMDFIQGLASRDVAVDFLKKYTCAAGVISTKPPLVRYAMERGLLGIQRAFVVDSIALENTKKQMASFHPDALEILPGIAPKVIREVCGSVDVPVIAGGLLSEKKDIMDAFRAGADAVSTTREALWYS